VCQHDGSDDGRPPPADQTSPPRRPRQQRDADTKAEQQHHPDDSDRGVGVKPILEGRHLGAIAPGQRPHGQVEDGECGVPQRAEQGEEPTQPGQYRTAIPGLMNAALTVLGQVEVWSGAVIGGPRLAVAAVIAGGTAAVAFRRRAPLTVVVVCSGSLGVQGLLGVDSDSAFAPLFALFLAVGSAAFYARHPVLALIVAILLIWPVILIDKGLAPGDLLYAAVLLGLAWSVGPAFAVGRLRAQLAEQRVEPAPGCAETGHSLTVEPPAADVVSRRNDANGLHRHPDG